MFSAIRNRIYQSFHILQAIIVRLGFCAHNIVATYFLYDDIKDYWCLLNLCGTSFLVIELVVTIIERRGHEPKWFSPSFFIFILTSMPSLWLLEMRRVAQRRFALISNDNRTETTSFDRFMLKMGHDEFDTYQHLPHNLFMKKFRIDVDLETKTMGLEISLLLLIVVGRWILPKGVTSRSNLSQLLLVYMSIASDVIDLLTIFSEDQVLSSQKMLIATFIVLSWSLLQFSTNMISSNKSNRSATNENQIRKEKKRKRLLIFHPVERLFGNDAWYLYELNLMTCSATQLALRLVAVIKFDVRSYSTLFFTCRNGMILFLQFYRLIAIVIEDDSDESSSSYKPIDNQEKTMKNQHISLNLNDKNFMVNS